MSSGGLTLAEYAKGSPYVGAVQLSRGPNPSNLDGMPDEKFQALQQALLEQGIEIQKAVSGSVTAILNNPIIDTHVHGRGGRVDGYRGDILMNLAQEHFTKNIDGLLYMPNTAGSLLVDAQGNKIDSRFPEGHIATVEQYMKYRELLNETDKNRRKHIITISLTDDPKNPLTLETIKRLKDEPDFGGVKYYPAGATTNAEHGNTHINLEDPRIAYMAEHHIPFHIHPETSIVLGPDGYPTRGLASDAEREFIGTIRKLHEKYPNLPIVMEHISTKEAAELMEEGHENIYATVTSQHLLLCEGDVNTGNGVLLHNGVCRPTVKGAEDLRAIQKLVLSGNPRMMMGTDSAPHFDQMPAEIRKEFGISKSIKETSCCANGVVSSPDVVRMMWQFFEENGCLEHFAGFMGRNAIEAFPQIWEDTKVTTKILTNSVSAISQRLVLPGDERFSLTPMLADTKVRWSYN